MVIYTVHTHTSIYNEKKKDWEKKVDRQRNVTFSKDIKCGAYLLLYLTYMLELDKNKMFFICLVFWLNKCRDVPADLTFRPKRRAAWASNSIKPFFLSTKRRKNEAFFFLCPFSHSFFVKNNERINLKL